MTTVDFARLLRFLDSRQPFRRYELVFNSGDRVQVRHPETIEQREDLFSHTGADRAYFIFSASGVSNVRVLPRPGTATGGSPEL
jgi:hypothetical protein